MAVIYDTGMLIHLDQGRSRARELHRRILERGGHRPIVSAPVLGQAWRPGRGSYTKLKPYLAGCTVYAARDSRPPYADSRGWDDTAASCLPCLAGHTEQDAKRIGALAARVKLPAKKAFDAVDALVMIIALHHERSLVVTTDLEDMLAYREALDVHHVGVCHPDQPARIY
ncbi:hypothetical protein ACTWP5_04355 [Streptomyces sp. 4N509B]|uniref:hypothetical protein n=1 Tax=Streptomyces sp. 4N509B TaxID=3457413 RepID=UPI003FD20BC4